MQVESFVFQNRHKTIYQTLATIRMEHTEIGKYLKNIFDLSFKADIELWNSFSERMFLRKFIKNEFIKKTNETEKYLNFILKGSIGNFVFNNGNETCISLSINNNFSSDYFSFLKQKPSLIYSIALEKTEVLSISNVELSKLYSKSTSGVWLGKTIAEQLFIQRQQMQIDLLTLTAKERYLKLLFEKPELIQKISLKHIASYIGVTPESLSRLRKEIVN
jgi:CRP-like cAMP-binding protein